MEYQNKQSNSWNEFKNSANNNINTESLNFSDIDYQSFIKIAQAPSSFMKIDIEIVNLYIEKFSIENVDTFKHITVFIYRLFNLSGFTDLLITSVDFLTNMFGIEKFLEYGKSLYHKILEIITKLYNNLIMAPPTTEGRATDALRFIKSNLNLVYNSNIVTAIRDFVLTLVSFGCFKRKANDKIINALGPAPKASGFDLIDRLLESTVTFLDFSEQVYNGSPLSELFSHKDPVAAFTNEAHQLETLKDLTYSGLPVDGKVCRREYLNNVTSCILAGEAVVAALPIAAPQRRPVDMSLKKMKLIKATFINMMNAEERPMPYCICVTGSPGIGKGLLIDYFGMVWSNAKGRTYDSSHVYHRQATEEYWSGYEPASKPIIHYSEPGSLNVQIARTRGDPVMTEFLSVCDNQPYMCNMADVDSKGKVFALPELIVMDCNDPKMNLDQIINNPSAVRRRILYVEPFVKKEFTKPDGKRIDQAKSLNSTTPKLDRWTFNVWHEVPVNNKESEKQTVLKNASIYELTTFLNEQSLVHITEQENRVNILKNVSIKDYIQEANHIQSLLDYSPIRYESDFITRSNVRAESRLKQWRFYKEPFAIAQDWIDYIVSSFILSLSLKHLLSFFLFLFYSFGLGNPWAYFVSARISTPLIVAFTAPLSEEIFKEYFPAGSHFFGIFEFLYSGAGVHRIPALLFHCSHFNVPFQDRLSLHCLNNIFLLFFELFYPCFMDNHFAMFLGFAPLSMSLTYYLEDELIDKAKQTVKAFANFVASVLQVVWLFVISSFAIIVPARVYKWIAIRMLRSKINVAKDETRSKYQYFRATLGLKNTYTCKKVPEYRVASLITVFSAVLFMWRCGSFVRNISAEGSVVSTSKEWSEEEVTSELDRIEKECRCERPPPRQRRGNGVDWESLDRPAPVPVTQEQRKDKAEIVNRINRNIRVARFFGDKVTEGRIFGICEDMALVNRHTMCHAKNNVWEVEFRLFADDDTSLRKCTIDKGEMFPVDGDIWLIRVRGLKFKDIRPYIAERLVTPAIYGNIGEIFGEKVLIKRSHRIVATDANWGVVPIEVPLMYKWNNHAKGMCGIPLLMEYSGGFGIVGIHAAGTNSTDSYSQSIDLVSITKAMDYLNENSCTLGVNSEGKIRLPPGQSIGRSVNRHSPICFEDVKGIDVFGTLTGYTAMRLGKSKLEESPFLSYAEKLTGVSPIGENGHPLYGAPPFSHGFNVETGEYQAPYNHFVKKCGVVKNSLHPKILRKSIQVISDHLISGLQSKGVTELKPVPLAVAINGDPEDFYSRPVRPSTSGGWAWPGKKSKHMRDCCLPFKEDAKEFTQDVNEQVLEQLLAYERGEDALPLLGAQLKDEPRSYTKIKDRKTRVFCMSPVESTLVNKMFLSPFYTKMVEYDDLFCAAIGINMHSSDVTDLVNKMTTFSDKFMEGDYGGYDTSMPYDIGLAANTIVHDVLQHFGYTDRELEYVRGILSDNLYPTIVMRGDVFAAPALQPSGKYATAEDNSLRGLILLVYAFIEECTAYGSTFSERTRTTDFQPEDFFKTVRPVVYGDDMVAGVKPALQDHFNNITYQKFCSEVYGLDFTNAQKTMEMNKFLNWDETSFLKRSFVYREDLGEWVAPIELASIMKSICYYLPSRSVNSRDQLIDSCVSAARELFFHLRSDEYDQRRWEFAEVIAEIYELQSTDVVKKFPTFEEIRTQCFGERFTLL
jgi:hypothetical protein